MARWSDEVEAGVDKGVSDLNGKSAMRGRNKTPTVEDKGETHLNPLHPGLSLQVGVKLLVYVGQDGFPAPTREGKKKLDVDMSGRRKE